MSRRDDILWEARYYRQLAPFKASPEWLIYFFEKAGCEQIPGVSQLNDAMTRDYGVNMNGSVKHWCGIFCCAILVEAGLSVRWSLTKGTMADGKGTAGVITKKFTSGKAGARAGIQPADVAIIPARSHHFMILEIDEDKQTYTTLEGNTYNQYIRVVQRPFYPSDAGQRIGAFWKTA